MLPDDAALPAPWDRARLLGLVARALPTRIESALAPFVKGLRRRFTRDADRAIRLQERMESRLLGLNTFGISVAETPFGGVKESGHGSEGGPEGLEVYLTTKFVAQGPGL